MIKIISDLNQLNDQCIRVFIIVAKICITYYCGKERMRKSNWAYVGRPLRMSWRDCVHSVDSVDSVDCIHGVDGVDCKRNMVLLVLLVVLPTGDYHTISVQGVQFSEYQNDTRSI